MSQIQNKRLCPFCRSSNDCRANSDSCWCFNTAIPNELLQLLPPRADKSCICSACIQAYKTNPQAFAGKYLQST